MIAGYCYLMSGGQYDYTDAKILSKQSSFAKGPTVIGENCRLGARGIVRDNIIIGDGVVIGAHAMVTSYIPPDMVAVGIPARVVRSRFLNNNSS